MDCSRSPAASGCVVHGRGSKPSPAWPRLVNGGRVTIWNSLENRQGAGQSTSGDQGNVIRHRLINLPQRHEWRPLPPEPHAELHRLYEAGLYLDAATLASRHGPPARWAQPAARVMAGRLALNLGAPRLGHWFFATAFRLDPNDDWARVFWAHRVLEQRGPVAAWQHLEHWGSIEPAIPHLAADLAAFRGRVLGHFRDFESAWAWLAHARSIEPESPWLCVEAATLLQMEDRVEEAEEELRTALRLRPWFRPAVQTLSDMLLARNADGEAIDLLLAAHDNIQSGALVMQLITAAEATGEDEAIPALADRAEELLPWIEPPVSRWLAHQRADALVRLDRINEAAAVLRSKGCGPDDEDYARRLEAPGPCRRIRLPVPFVRQDRDTCAPATLEALTSYWAAPLPMREAVAELTFDGTAAHAEREWIEKRGYWVREFRLTRDVARALLERGIPFGLSTWQPGGGHRQAVIGIDPWKDTFIIRDPNVRNDLDYRIDALIRLEGLFGPRAIVLLPERELPRMEGIELPDVEVFDLWHRFRLAIDAHDPATAASLLDDAARRPAGCPLANLMAVQYASYHGDPDKALAALRQIPAEFSEHLWVRLQTMGFLNELGRREEALALLERATKASQAPQDHPEKPGEESKPGPHPVFLSMLASELTTDARRAGECRRILRRYLRLCPDDAGAIAQWGQLYWDAMDHERALIYLRFAACLADKQEGPSNQYLFACRHLKREEEALEWLRGRFRRYAAKSTEPVKTLVRALRWLNRDAEAESAWAEALELRPDDADLQVALLHDRLSQGRLDEAQQLLERTRGRVQRADWAWASSWVAEARQDWEGQLQALRQVCEECPLAVSAWARLAVLIAASSGRFEALAQLESICSRFPEHLPLARLRLGWLLEEGAEVAIEPARAIADRHGWSAEAKRDVASICLSLDQTDDAERAAAEAAEMEPGAAASWMVWGGVRERVGDIAGAMVCWKRALGCHVDIGDAILRLARVERGQEERLADLRWILDQAITRTLTGEALFAWRHATIGQIEAQEILDGLRQGREQNPGLPAAWLAEGEQLLALRRHVEASELAAETARRFPLRTEVWNHLARSLDAVGQRKEAIDAVARGLEIDPGNIALIAQRADLLNTDGRGAEALECLRRGVASNRMHPGLRMVLARQLWNAGDRDEALAEIHRILEIEPAHDPAWDALMGWCSAMDRRDHAVQMARNLTHARPGEAWCWLALARLLDRVSEGPDRLAAIDRALALRPRFEEAHDLKAIHLAEERRFDEALAACRNPVWGDRLPLILRGRIAWIEACRGRTKEAIAEIERVVASEPGYTWGWDQLAVWRQQLGDVPGAANAVKQLARLDPESPVPWHRLAILMETAKAHQKMRAAVREALARDPGHLPSAIRAFDFDLRERGAAAAQAVVRAARPLLPEADRLLFDCHVAIREHRIGEALSTFSRLCTGTPPPGYVFNHLQDLIPESGKQGTFEGALDRAVALREVNAGAAVLWVVWKFRRQNISLADTIAGLPEDHGVRHEAAIAYLDFLAQLPDAAPVLADALRKHEPWIRRNTVLWGKAGFALAKLGMSREALHWLRDWEERRDAEGWMLFNVALAHTMLGQWRAGAEVALKALYHFRRDSTAPFLRVLAGLILAERGELAEAQAMISGVVEDQLDDRWPFLFKAARIMAARAPETPKENVDREINRLLRKASAQKNAYLPAYAILRSLQSGRPVSDEGIASGGASGLAPSLPLPMPAAHPYEPGIPSDQSLRHHREHGRGGRGALLLLAEGLAWAQTLALSSAVLIFLMAKRPAAPDAGISAPAMLGLLLPLTLGIVGLALTILARAHDRHWRFGSIASFAVHGASLVVAAALFSPAARQLLSPVVHTASSVTHGDMAGSGPRDGLGGDWSGTVYTVPTGWFSVDTASLRAHRWLEESAERSTNIVEKLTLWSDDNNMYAVSAQHPFLSRQPESEDLFLAQQLSGKPFPHEIENRVVSGPGGRRAVRRIVSVGEAPRRTLVFDLLLVDGMVYGLSTIAFGGPQDAVVEQGRLWDAVKLHGAGAKVLLVTPHDSKQRAGPFWEGAGPFVKMRVATKGLMVVAFLSGPPNTAGALDDSVAVEAIEAVSESGILKRGALLIREYRGKMRVIVQAPPEVVPVLMHHGPIICEELGRRSTRRSQFEFQIVGNGGESLHILQASAVGPFVRRAQNAVHYLPDTPEMKAKAQQILDFLEKRFGSDSSNGLQLIESGGITRLVLMVAGGKEQDPVHLGHMRALFRAIRDAFFAGQRVECVIGHALFSPASVVDLDSETPARPISGNMQGSGSDPKTVAAP